MLLVKPLELEHSLMLNDECAITVDKRDVVAIDIPLRSVH
jgi:hypothetical protein